MDWRLPAALVGACVLAAVNLLNLIGSQYAALVEQQLSSPYLKSTRKAAEIARALQPWSSERHALYGWVLAENGEPAAQGAYIAALRWAPGEPTLWGEYAMALARLNIFDAQMTHAMSRVQQIAPTSGAGRQVLADLGLSYWARGTREQRSLWLSGMRYALDRNRASFLAQVFTRGQGETFCRDPAIRLGESEWCAAMAPAFAGRCFTLSETGPRPCTTIR